MVRQNIRQTLHRSGSIPKRNPTPRRTTIHKPKLKTMAHPATDKKNLMLQYSIVYRCYKDSLKKLVTYRWLTDGFISVPVSGQQANQMLRQASEHQRYEIGAEVYIEPTGKTEIDGYPEKKEDMTLELQSVMFYHVFIRAEHFDEIFNDMSTDRKITWDIKGEAVKNRFKTKEAI